MKNINYIISENLKRIREEKKLSLDALARLSGVSKSMLGQIERGDVNPTVSTVWKIANGVKVPFTELMTRPETEFEVVRKADIQVIEEDEGRYRNFAVFPFDPNRRFETYYIEMDPGSFLEAQPHMTGAEEFITVFSGVLTVCTAEEKSALAKGDSIRFKADRPHTYQNSENEICCFSILIFYDTFA